MEEVQDTCPCCSQPVRERYLRVGASDGAYLTATRGDGRVVLSHASISSIVLSRHEVAELIAWLQAA